MNTTTRFLAPLIGAAILSFFSCTRDKVIVPEIIPSDGTKLTINGGTGGADAENAVYLDLSTDKQVAVKRQSWDLGFYNGSEFRVVLNNQIGVSAMSAKSSDLKAVNSTSFDISQLGSGFTPEKMALYDDTAGRINQTVIAEVKSNATENQVYVIHTAFSPSVDKANVWKIKVLRNGDAGYTLQYAKIDDTEFQTTGINKNTSHNFNFFSLTGGVVNLEPAKDDWDLVWSKAMSSTAMGSSQIPYIFSDLVFTNYLNGVTAVQVIAQNTDGSSTSNPSYEAFTEADLAKFTLATSRNTIGSNWRATTGKPAGAYTGRYYLVKDVAGNIYKLKFLAMGAGEDGGTRGNPELEYKLVKRK